MAYLLDVNVLIALIDPAHTHHNRAHEWFADGGSPAWATCPITENAVLRIGGDPRYPASPGSPAAVAPVLAGLRAHPGHLFWPEGVSLLDQDLVDVERLLASGQVTDSYLLTLAVANRGRLATFDRRLRTEAVRHGAAHLHLID